MLNKIHKSTQTETEPNTNLNENLTLNSDDKCNEVSKNRDFFRV